MQGVSREVAMGALVVVVGVRVVSVLSWGVAVMVLWVLSAWAVVVVGAEEVRGVGAVGEKAMVGVVMGAVGGVGAREEAGREEATREGFRKPWPRCTSRLHRPAVPRSRNPYVRIPFGVRLCRCNRLSECDVSHSLWCATVPLWPIYV